ncbi:MAG: nucleotidyltransferase domain-containing protein [Candidatus Margulisiibacteriota bacterium]
MRLEHYSLSRLKNEINRIVGKHLALKSYRIFFFGSRVSGSGSERSDIDIGIEGPQSIPLEIMARIKEDIEGLPALYKIDIVDFKNVSEDFKKVALSRTEDL